MTEAEVKEIERRLANLEVQFKGLTKSFMKYCNELDLRIMRLEGKR